VITIYKTLFEVSTPFYRDIHFVLNRIKEGKNKELISLIRKEKDKKKRNELKEKLPAICFSGTFKTRSISGLDTHSGYICIDFDNYSNNEELNKQRELLLKDKYTFALFDSPSGDGLKCIVKIPAIKENHTSYFEALRSHYNSDNFDIHCKDVSRVCYESYDPNLFINDRSIIWDKIVENEGYSYIEREPVVALKSEDVIIEKLIKWFNKNHSMSEGSRNANLFILASAFNDYGVSDSSAIYYCQRFIDKSFSQKEVERTVRSAYSKRANHGTKYFEDNTRVNQIKNELKTGKSIEDISKSFIDVDTRTIETIAENNPNNIFWSKTDKGKVSIDNFKYKNWLQSNGFFKFYPEGSESFIFIRVENNLIDNTSEVKVKDFVLAYLLEQKEFEVYQYVTNQPRFFKEDILNTLDTTSVKFMADTKTASYLYFKNCAIEVYKDKVNYIDYIDLDGFVWKKHIIDFEYSKSDVECDFNTFIRNISGKNDDKELSIRSTIGYLLSSYKDSSNNVAVILNDEMISENPNGGTGKGIFINAISKLKRTSVIDGKNFDFKKTFAYQTVSADTQVIAFDDVPKNFAFENLFSVVTEGITLEKKNKDAIKIPISKSPKIVISTNYAIGGDGNSFDRRKWEVEFAQHYKKEHTPFDEFGKLLFDEWDNKEFNNFYSFMIDCLQIYIREGLIKSEFNNLKVRQFIAKTNYDFYEWTKDGKIETNVNIVKAVKFEEFVSDFPDFKKFLSRKRFTQWLEKYGEYKGYETISGNTLGQRWIQFNSKEDSLPY